MHEEKSSSFCTHSYFQRDMASCHLLSIQDNSKKRIEKTFNIVQYVQIYNIYYRILV